MVLRACKKKVIVTVLSMPEKMQQYLHLQVPTPIYQVWAEIVQTLYLNVWLRVGYIIKIVGMFIKKIINICILTIHPKTLVYLIIIN